MKRLEVFLIRQPVVTGFLLIVFFVILSALTWPISQAAAYPKGAALGESFAKLAMFGVFFVLLAGLRWLGQAGFAATGSARTWGWSLVLIVIKVPLAILAFTGAVWKGLPPADPGIYILVFTFSTALLEETIYRGLLLTAMKSAWGASRRGLFAAALVSGIFFGGLHLFNLGQQPLNIVLLQVLATVLAGFAYALIVIAGKSIWPAVFFHWMTNLGVNLQIAMQPEFVETTTAWGIELLAVLVVAVLAVRFFPIAAEPGS